MTYIAEIKDIPYDKKRADVVLSDGEICRAFKATIKEYGLVEGKNIDIAESPSAAALSSYGLGQKAGHKR